MRFLILLLALSFSTLISAQCSIEAAITAAYCNPDGEGFFLEFTVDGDGGSGWIAPGTNLSGSYDTQEVFVAGPLFNNPTGFLLIQDSLDQSCSTMVTLPQVECDDPCSAFDVWIEQETLGCGDQVTNNAYIGYFSNFGTVTIKVFSENNPDFFEQTFTETDTNIVLLSLPLEEMNLRVSNAEGCTLDTVLVPQINECGTISGIAWLDADFDGRRDAEENGIPSVTMLLLDANGGILDTAFTDDIGSYLFDDVPPFRTYTLRVLPADQEHELTTPGIGDDESDSDFLQSTFRTSRFSFSPGENIELDAGFVSTSCPGFEMTTFLDGTNESCGNQVQVVTIEADNFPVTITVLDSTTNIVFTQEIDANGDYLLEGVPPGIYLLQAVDAGNCMLNEVISIPALDGGLDISITREGSICEGDGIVLTAEVANAELSELTFAWNTQETTRSIVVTDNSQLYTVSVISSTGCTGEQRIFISDQFIDTIQVEPVTYFPCDSDTATLTILNPEEGAIYTWFGPLNQILEGATVNVTMPGFYSVQKGDEEDCFGTGFTWLVDPNLDDLEIVFAGNDSLSCGGETCLRVLGLGGVNSEPMEISWSGPPAFEAWNDTINWNRLSLCTPFPGDYTVTVTTECGNTSASYTVDFLTCSTLAGTLYLDSDGDCDLDIEDTPAAGFVLTLTNNFTGDVYYTYTAPDGTWSIELPDGPYTIAPVIAQGLPLESCDPATTVVLSGTAVTDVNVFMPVLFDCPVLTTEVTLPFLRRCFQGCAYVRYENTGTATGEDALVTVELDPFFIDVVPSIPPVSVEGNVYTFALGDLPPFTSGTIGFIFTISCEAELGQTHCIDASITPDDPCHNSDDWNGALVDITGAECLGDSLVFSVTNIGDSQMSIPLNYVIVEDGIMLSETPNVNGLLAPGEIYTIALEANGSTYAVITNQEPNAPGTAEPTFVFEGCSEIAGNFSTGFANILPLASGNPARSIVCRENVGSYDPNDKTGYPLGWDGGNIEEGTRLDYEIRFQNTGTDTAFTVVIRDTLAPELDIATFKMEAASHAYTVSIDTHRVITWIFNNIMLPDSSDNLLLSQGAVTFSIDHDDSLIPGNVIENEAAIYFDFNEPIITNISRHVIAKEGLPVSLRSAYSQTVNLSVYPNPASSLIKVDVAAEAIDVYDVLQVTDLHGRPLLQIPYGQLGSGLDVSQLPAGYYLLLVNDPAGRAKGRTAFVVTPQ